MLKFLRGQGDGDRVNGHWDLMTRFYSAALRIQGGCSPQVPRPCTDDADMTSWFGCHCVFPFKSMSFKHINKIVGYGTLRLRCFSSAWVDPVPRYPGSKATDGALWPRCLGVTVYSLSVEGQPSSGRSVVSIYPPMGFYLPVHLHLISLFTH